MGIKKRYKRNYRRWQAYGWGCGECDFFTNKTGKASKGYCSKLRKLVCCHWNVCFRGRYEESEIMTPEQRGWITQSKF